MIQSDDTISTRLDALSRIAKSVGACSGSAKKVIEFNSKVKELDFVLYNKSEAEGAVALRVMGAAFMPHTDAEPVVELEHIGVVLLRKVILIPEQDIPSVTNFFACVLFGVGVGIAFLPILLASLITRKNLYLVATEAMVLCLQKRLLKLPSPTPAQCQE